MTQKSAIPLGINQMTDLCLLGVLKSRETLAFDEIVAITQNLDLGNWEPTREVLLFAMERLISGGHTKVMDEDLFSLSLTQEGQRFLNSLLLTPLPDIPQLKAACVSLKSYFLETAPKEVVDDVVLELTCHYKCQLQGLGNDCRSCPLGSDRKHLHQRQNLDLIEQELKWLKDLAAANSTNVRSYAQLGH